MSLKIVSWNIERGYDPDKIITFLKNLKADIYCLQEVDRFVKRTNSTDVLKVLEEGLGMKSYYTKEFDEIDSWQRGVARPVFGRGGGEQGNAIFTNLEVKNVLSIDLPLPKTAYDSKIQIPLGLRIPFKGNRVAQLASIIVKGERIQIVNAHLDAWNAYPFERLNQLKLILSKLEPDKKTIFCGDLNTLGTFNWYEIFFGESQQTEVDSFRLKFADNDLFDPFDDKDTTQNFLSRHHKLDWIAVSEKFKVIDFALLQNKISDHECLAVELDF